MLFRSVAALRAAFMATMTDAAFKDELRKRHLSLQPMAGDAVQTLIAALHAFPPEVTGLALDLAN